jgi:NitT/TauT family transport system ATP-binding protein
MQQRVGLARALANEPEVLLLDEPFAALDAITRDAMNQELQRVWSARPCSVVLVTHSVPEAVLLADRVITLSNRPARVVAVTPVGLGRPRPIALEHSPEFQELVHQVRRSLGAE